MQSDNNSSPQPDFKRLRAIFDGDGTEIRDQFIFASLILMIFEQFKKYVVHQVDGFLAARIEIQNGDLKYMRGEEFKALIKEKGAGDPGQHDNRVFRAALHWFFDLGAIERDELDDVERLYTLRNEIGHELLRIIADDTKAIIRLGDVLIAFGVYVKIVRWWVKEVEATTNPGVTPELYENTAWDKVESTGTIFLREILHKALAGNAEWEELQKAVHAASPAPQTE
jgi:hypothetical protein